MTEKKNVPSTPPPPPIPPPIEYKSIGDGVSGFPLVIIVLAVLTALIICASRFWTG